MSHSASKPTYYDAVAARARKLCLLLEQEPDLSGAWNLLFEQIQNPGFVISELLQNADDAGATYAEVSLDDKEFIFSHNGQDFNEDQFASLCRFGFSNKRTIHTIGFRGIGFKSTFSLGRTVEVWSPSLALLLEGRNHRVLWSPGERLAKLKRLADALQADWIANWDGYAETEKIQPAAEHLPARTPPARSRII